MTHLQKSVSLVRDTLSLVNKDSAAFSNKRIRCLVYVGILKLAIIRLAGSRYFLIDASCTVRVKDPPHLVQAPRNGIRRYFVLHFTHRICCLENARKFPMRSGKKCVWITLEATSLSSTARIFRARFSCAISLSSIFFNVLYADTLTPSAIWSVS